MRTARILIGIASAIITISLGYHLGMQKAISSSVILERSFAERVLDYDSRVENEYRLMMMERGEKGCPSSPFPSVPEWKGYGQSLKQTKEQKK